MPTSYHDIFHSRLYFYWQEEEYKGFSFLSFRVYDTLFSLALH